MFYLGIDQHHKQLTISLRDGENGKGRPRLFEPEQRESKYCIRLCEYAKTG